MQWADAAYSFELPENWQDGRPLKSGTAMDPINTVVRDDAYEIQKGEDGKTVLEVNIADIGSFMDDEPDLVDHAEARLFTRYARKRPPSTIWPERISNTLFSLTDTAEKPVVTINMPISEDPDTLPEIGFGRLRAKLLSPWEFESTLRNGSPDSQQLYQIARQLYLYRMGKYPEESKSTQQVMPDNIDFEKHPARFTLRELMVYANIGLTRYIRAHRIPSINLTDRPGEAIFPEGSEESRALQNRKLARFTVEHLPYKELPSYSRGTSPLITFDSFANLANTSASLRGKPFMFRARSLQNIARRMTRLQHNRIANGIMLDESDATEQNP